MIRPLLFAATLLNICVAKICNIQDFGAVGDGVTDDTNSIQKAMDSCTSTETEESIIKFPASYVFYTYPLRFNKNNLNLWIEENSTFYAATNWTNGKWPYNDTTSRYVHIIQNDPAKQLSNVSIYGKGLINGNGWAWWPVENNTNNGGIRPYTIVFQDCLNVSIYDISVYNSPAWFIYIYRNIGVVIHDINLTSQFVGGHNQIWETDGIDIGSTNVHIYNCYISTGDDSYALKDGANNVLIENSISYNASAACICVGTGSEQPNPVQIYNCTIRNMICNDCNQAALKVKQRMKKYDDQYGEMSFITFKNITLINVEAGISINNFNQSMDAINGYQYVSYHDIQFIDISGSYNDWMGHLDCAQETPCYNLSFSNINMKPNNNDADGWVCSANVYGTAVDVTPPLTCLNNK